MTTSARASRRHVALWTALVALAASRAMAAPAPSADLRSPPAVDTPVAAALFLNDVSDVDDARQQATVDLALRVMWRDPRLAGRFSVPTQLGLDEVWTPRFTVMNDRSLEPRLPEKVVVEPDGTMRLTERYVGDVTFTMNLADFPFDQQALQLPVLFIPLPGEAAFHRDSTLPAMGKSLSLPGWSFRPPSVELSQGSIFSPAHVRLTLTLPMRRQFGYFVWTVFLPLLLVVVMGMLPFWIEHNIEARVGLSATSVLTLIAFRFALSQSVPHLAYLTRMDAFVMVSTLLVFLSLIGVGALSHLTLIGKTALSRRLDGWARIVFPVAALVLSIVSLGRRWH